jgi:hypothetical protein
VTDLLTTVLLLLAIGGIIAGMLGLLRRRGLRDAGPDGTGWFAAGLVSAFAVASLAPTGPAGIAAGAIVGIVFAVLAVLDATRIRSVVVGVLGAAGTVAVVPRLIADDCSPLPWYVRLGAVLFVATSAGIGLVAATLAGRLSGRSGLALFGAIEIVALLASPYGVSIVELGAAATIVACVVAALLGAAAAFAPGAVIGFAAFALTAASLVVSVTIGGPCDTRGSADGLVLPIAFTIAFALVRGVGRMLRR